MLLKRINRDDPEKIFIVVKNGYTTTAITSGQALSWDLVAVDGVTVTLPAAYTGIAFAGIAVQTIAYGAYGMLQIYGYNSSVIVKTLTGGTPAGAAGVALAMTAAAFHLETMAISLSSTAAVPVQVPCGFLLAAQASFTTKAVAAFIKAM